MVTYSSSMGHFSPDEHIVCHACQVFIISIVSLAAIFVNDITSLGLTLQRHVLKIELQEVSSESMWSKVGSRSIADGAGSTNLQK